ncbi:MAG: lactate utilization protein C, partial [Propionibacteriaceae bacterium]|nr:lactate utilization protein C [Propionibacteriaceae bacterium]
MSSKEAMLGRIRSALTDVTPMAPADDVAVEWTYGQRPPGASDDMLGLFVERVEDYKAVVSWVVPDEVPVRIANALADHDVTSAVIPAGAPAAWHEAVAAAGIAVVTDDP